MNTKSSFFVDSEFACGCGCGLTAISSDLAAMLNQARGLSGQPYQINSGRRCPAHNQAVGGSPTSSHLDGLAVDIKITTDRHRGAVLYGLINAGFRRIGIGPNYIHADIDPRKSGAVWLYS